MRVHHQRPVMSASWTMRGATVVRVLPVREATRAVAKEVLGASLAKKIATRHRKGFQALSSVKVIRPEIVLVYALKR